MPQTDKFEFADLNIMHNSNAATTLALVKRAIRLGYDTVAINIDVGDLNDVTADEDDPSEPPRKKKKKGGSKVKSIPEPFKVDVSKLDLSELEAAGKQFRQYSRLTVALSETGAVHTLMHDATAKKYDIIAARPANEQLLTTLANKGEIVDLISFDGTEKCFWLNRGKIVQLAVEKGMGMEISYAPALSDSSARRQVFANARQLLAATRGGRGVVLTSKADAILDLRAPYDAANLVTLFGGTPDLGRKLVSANAKRVLLRADAKKTIRGAIRVQSLTGNTQTTVSLLDKLVSVPEFRAEIEIVRASTAACDDVS
uniref:Ribonuclease P protein subunit p30 n=1 Tax=Plectus sambesii TaxID=2011161 RepID=A0A914WX37_9BILA